MTERQTWFITGAGRGMGTDIAKAALTAGHNVIASGRNPDAGAEAVGEAGDLLVVKLDITSREDAEAAVNAAVERFRRVDVLVNNAANVLRRVLRRARPPEQIERQPATNVIGPANVTRAVNWLRRRSRRDIAVHASGSKISSRSQRGPPCANSPSGPTCCGQTSAMRAPSTQR